MDLDNPPQTPLFDASSPTNKIIRPGGSRDKDQRAGGPSVTITNDFGSLGDVLKQFLEGTANRGKRVAEATPPESPAKRRVVSPVKVLNSQELQKYIEFVVQFLASHIHHVSKQLIFVREMIVALDLPEPVGGWLKDEEIGPLYLRSKNADDLKAAAKSDGVQMTLGLADKIVRYAAAT